MHEESRSSPSGEIESTRDTVARDGRIAALRQSVVEQGALARVDFPGHGTALALAWQRLAECLGEAGDLVAAMAAADRCVAVFEQCYAHSAAFHDSLIRALEFRSLLPVGLNRPASRIDPLRRLVEIRRERLSCRPGAHARASLAAAQLELAECLGGCNQLAEAIAMGHAAVAHAAQADREAAGYSPQLVTAHATLAILLAQADRAEEATTAFDHALQACHAVATDSVLAAIAEASRHAQPTGDGRLLGERGQRSGAAELDKLRRMLARHPNQDAICPSFAGAAAQSLESCAQALASSGHPAGTVALLQRAELAAADRYAGYPDAAHFATLAHTLRALAGSQRGGGNDAAARATMERLVARHRERASADPGEESVERLADALDEFGRFLTDAGDEAGALEAGRAMVDELRRQAAAGAWLQRRLAQACEDVSALYRAAGDHAAAMAWLEQAVEAYRRCPAEPAPPGEPATDALLAHALSRLSAERAGNGDDRGSAAALREAGQACLAAARGMVAEYRSRLDEPLEEMWEHLTPAADAALLDYLHDWLEESRNAIREELDCLRDDLRQAVGRTASTVAPPSWPPMPDAPAWEAPPPDLPDDGLGPDAAHSLERLRQGLASMQVAPGVTAGVLATTRAELCAFAEWTERQLQRFQNEVAALSSAVETSQPPSRSGPSGG